MYKVGIRVQFYQVRHKGAKKDAPKEDDSLDDFDDFMNSSAEDEQSEVLNCLRNEH